MFAGVVMCLRFDLCCCTWLVFILCHCVCLCFMCPIVCGWLFNSFWEVVCGCVCGLFGIWLVCTVCLWLLGFRECLGFVVGFGLVFDGGVILAWASGIKM